MRPTVFRIFLGLTVSWLAVLFFLFGRLLGSTPNIEIKIEPVGQVNILSAVSPHHLLAREGIENLFSTIGSDDVRTVVVLSPNHFSFGRSAAQISLSSWSTPDGELLTDQAAAEKLLADVSFLKNEEETFKNEHGIFALTPFIKKYFPKANIVALAIHDKLSVEDAKTLAETIARDLPNAFVIASADMSHYLPHYAAAFHDEITERTLARGCQNDLCEVDLEVDSNNILSMLMQINRIRGTEVFSLTGHSDALALTDSDNWKENTSHLLGYFIKGEPVNDNFISFHFVGDIMLDRGTRKQIDTANSVDYPWVEMERFLDGTDFVVGNLEGTVNEQSSTYTYDPPFRFVFDPTYVEEANKYLDAVSLANNHASDVGSAGELETHDWLEQMGLPWFGSYLNSTLRYDTTIGGRAISFIGYHTFQPNEQEFLSIISAAKTDGNFVIVMPHWGTEYLTSPDTSEQRLAKLIVEAGADLIIGGHPHVPQGFEVMGDTPVAYSLGNFIFDQYLPETWTALTLGVIISDSQIEIHLLPVYTKDSQPIPISDIEAQKMFSDLAAVSPVSLQEQIKKGILIFPRYEETN